MKRLYKPVYIEWEDACSNTNGWMNLDEAKEWCNKNKWYVHQLGFIIHEDQFNIYIAGEYEPGGIDNKESVGLLQKIPTTWIRKRIDLTRYVEKDTSRVYARKHTIRSPRKVTKKRKV